MKNKVNYLDLIERLKRATPQQRADILKKVREKNIAFFRRDHAELADAIEMGGTGNYEIRITHSFLEIIDRESGGLCHPPENSFLEYIQMLGAPHHTGWIDRVSPVPMLIGEEEQIGLSREFATALYETVPATEARIRTGTISLPPTADGRRFSGATLFLGTFISLHILHYLNRTEVYAPVFVEPDLKKFALSCCFLDYQALEERYGRLVLHVGEEFPESVIDELVSSKPITSNVWVRMLPAYLDDRFNATIGRIVLRWRALVEIMVPFERELRNLLYGTRNLKSGLPLLRKPASLGKGSRVAVVASGPSLEQDLPWLKANQDRLIIFSALSAVRVLEAHGIRPDFQCTLDTELEEGLLEKLAPDFNVPLISYYKTSPEILAHFNDVLLVAEGHKANPAHLPCYLMGTHPTTGNLVVAAAAAFQPEALYMLGYDLGFRDAAKSHVKGTWYDDEEGAGHASEGSRQSISVKANFDESQGEIYTHSYFNSSRGNVESVLAALAETEVYNFSDGVAIAGARAKHSGEVNLEVYSDKPQHLAALHSAFDKDENPPWQPFTMTGKELLETLRNTLKEIVTLDEFRWSAFAAALDSANMQILARCMRQSKPENMDIRAEIYSRLTTDLLANWFRQMILTGSREETEKLYRAGIEKIDEALAKLEWPTELDSLQTL